MNEQPMYSIIPKKGGDAIQDKIKGGSKTQKLTLKKVSQVKKTGESQNSQIGSARNMSKSKNQR